MVAEPARKCVALVRGRVGHIDHATGVLVVAIVDSNGEGVCVALKAQPRGQLVAEPLLLTAYFLDEVPRSLRLLQVLVAVANRAVADVPPILRRLLHFLRIRDLVIPQRL